MPRPYTDSMGFLAVHQLATGTWKTAEICGPRDFPLLFICFLWGHYPSTVCNTKQPKYTSTETWLNKACYSQWSTMQVQKGTRKEYLMG